CFSEHYWARDKTFMNEELLLAIEELRQRRIDRAWFIPVKLSPCEVPEYPIGPGQSLRDLQYVEMYKDWETGIRKVLSVIQLQFEPLVITPHLLESLSQTEEGEAVLSAL